MEKRNCQRNLQQSRRIFQRRGRFSLAAVAALASIAMVGKSFASSGTWNGQGTSGTTADSLTTPPPTFLTDTGWTNTANWVGGTIAGATNSPSNTDTATFGDTALTGNNGVTVDANRYIQNITFSGTSTQYALGFNGTPPAGLPANNTLYLTDGGTAMVASTVTSTTGSDAVNDPVVLTGSTYTFDSESSSANGALKFNGTVTGSPTAASTTLYLTGVNYTTQNKTGSCIISNNLVNGAGPLNVVKNGIGTWTLTGAANNFNSLTINSGAVRFNTNLGSMPAGASITINGGPGGATTGGYLSISTTSLTFSSLTINAGGQSASSIPLYLANTSGPALTLQLNYNGLTTTKIANSFFLTGGTADQGGVLVNGDSTYDSQIALGTTVAIDLGGVDRDFDIETVAGSSTPDLQVDGVISATPVAGVEGGLIKTGPGSMSVLGANTYTGQTSVSAGVLSISATGSIVSTTVGAGTAGRLNANGTTNFGLSTSTALTSTGNVFLTSAATSLNTASLASITLQAGGAVTVSDPATHADRTLLTITGSSGLTFGGTTNAWQGKLNLNGNDLIVKGVGATGLANITNQLKEGFSSGTSYWNGANGIVSSTAANDTTYLTALGSRSGGISFDGVSTTATDVLVKYTYYGDANLDGSVNGADYQQIDLGFGSHLTGWSNGDFNYDGVVDGSDFSLIDNTFNQINASGASPLAVVAGSADLVASPADVPEPTTLALLGIGVMGLLGRRRRRNT
jgi:fibronectin-binding autotransporter adhesin